MASTSKPFSPPGEDLLRMKSEASAVAEMGRVTTETCRTVSQSAATVIEVEQVRCECCGLAEECTPAYIAHVRGIHCGRWVCGLCAEAVKEERGRCGGVEGEEGMEDALQAHMSYCMQFNNPGKESPVANIAAAMSRLLRRSVDAGSSRSAPSSPRRAIRSSRNCPKNFSRGFEAPL